MKFFRVVCSLCVFFCLLSLMDSEAKDERQEDTKGQQTEPQGEQRLVEQEEIVYKPPSPSLIRKPGGRVGGSSRGRVGTINDPTSLVFAPEDQTALAAQEQPGGKTGELTFFVFAPEDHTGLTTQEQPVLYWYISQPMSVPIVFTLVTDQADEPLVEESFSVSSRSGLQRVRLADYGIRLSPGVHYQWSITLSIDPLSPSKNLLAEGAIERVEPAVAFRARLTQATKRDIPRLYATEGFWYDAMSALVDLLETSPRDAWLRRQRASLLQQVELPGVD